METTQAIFSDMSKAGTETTARSRIQKSPHSALNSITTYITKILK
jgi:hypothetical protein